MSLDGQPARSVRYREFMRPQGYDDELRSVFRRDNNTWGVVGLSTKARTRAFDADDVAIMQGIGATVEGALHAHVRGVTPWLSNRRRRDCSLLIATAR